MHTLSYRLPAAALERAGIGGDVVQEVIMGNVVSANLGQVRQAPGRRRPAAQLVAATGSCARQPGRAAPHAMSLC
jgi:hypothetical protein